MLRPPAEATAKSVQNAIADSEARLQSNGRMLIRKLGTEPLVRVRLECENTDMLDEIVSNLVATIEATVKSPNERKR